jgi:hypothetical protein
MYTASTADAARFAFDRAPGVKASSPLIAIEPNSAADKLDRPPRKLPIGVLE